MGAVRVLTTVDNETNTTVTGVGVGDTVTVSLCTDPLAMPGPGSMLAVAVTTAPEGGGV